jgi:DNA invertase Pin-like site-specific DNA recombinase
MQQHNNTGDKSNNSPKDNKRYNQLKTIFEYLQKNVATASMVADATGIYQKNICRYKRDLEKAGQLWELTKTVCKKTGFKAWYLTTDPNKNPNTSPQLNLF